MSSQRERNDPKSRKGQNNPKKPGAKPGFSGQSKPFAKDQARGKGGDGPVQAARPQNGPRPKTSIKVSEDGWVWGLHAVEAALKNPSRHGPIRLYVTPERQKGLPQAALKRGDLHVRVTEIQEFNGFLPQGAVHQGIALNGPPLEGDDLDGLMEAALRKDTPVLVMLDQVTDPQNIGAILRTCAAFGAAGLIMQDRHSPVMQGVLAKTAAGAMDRVPFARVTNLSRALESLSENGFVSVGMAGEAEHSLQTVLEQQGWRASDQKGGGSPRGLVVVMGSEGEGIRRLVAEHCDHLVKIPMPGGFESLNVSHATSIALYETLGRH
ncbi:23S rRNA (guanosine(2251)-2'-O)-methyltransferase RlmB [Asticcacaulis sp. AND118]|uniref:23S rRNA (guanosine(2251)-2'-O)-methyltransferase RlmB n=1 Tax=Asticcacaulis sp. AND118 TaxID=2840468 RepID=UPI001CFFF22B|nr:23S rRNA (guanosine(2251)-2'-O)-methyltransferase RlmB [Asticcacaulis sp. AND118]UDF02484.1 23S rRNA (guanosine(2251)-2'-O)-methyltransferase RlmB [Asticcacaulis sp. AND118]